MNQAVQEIDRSNAPQSSALVPAADSAREITILDVIAQAAKDPNANVDKLEKLLNLYERQKATDAKASFFAAMVAMKPKLPVIDRRGRIEVREKTSSGKRDGDVVQDTPYARWEDIDEAISPILAHHGFALTFRSGVAQDGKITVTGILGHTGGHSEETTITLPHDSSGSKNPVQAVGSSLTYGKRYAATFLLNIRTKGDDDDGVAAGADDPIDDGQFETIQDLIVRSGSDAEKFCAHMKVPSIRDLPRKDYDAAVTALNTKLHRSAQKGAAR